MEEHAISHPHYCPTFLLAPPQEQTEEQANVKVLFI